ncbi:hypothetical protein RMSM_07594 [Rhodopirellula maiorica SM1]|uniref:Uncharacterized protein n=1 Tax=Rhodopirellula maiorica SM1 TaxID=1265738 RepID=M5R7M8_9BACT|nr:hypothetical protein RMSM_07594 [Rhodopirellula maiorica SM1]
MEVTTAGLQIGCSGWFQTGRSGASTFKSLNKARAISAQRESFQSGRKPVRESASMTVWLRLY